MRCATDSVCYLSSSPSPTRLVITSRQASDRLLSQFQFERELGLKAVTHERSGWAVLRLDGQSIDRRHDGSTRLVYHGLKREGEATCCEDEMTANISVTSSQTPAVRNGTVYSKRTL